MVANSGERVLFLQPIRSLPTSVLSPRGTSHIPPREITRLVGHDIFTSDKGPITRPHDGERQGTLEERAPYYRASPHLGERAVSKHGKSRKHHFLTTVLITTGERGDVKENEWELTGCYPPGNLLYLLYFKHEITIKLQCTPLGPVNASVSPACNKTGL